MAKFHKHRTLGRAPPPKCPIFGILTPRGILHRFNIVAMLSPSPKFFCTRTSKIFSPENGTVYRFFIFKFLQVLQVVEILQVLQTLQVLYKFFDFIGLVGFIGFGVLEGIIFRSISVSLALNLRAISVRSALQNYISLSADFEGPTTTVFHVILLDCVTQP